MSFPDQSTNGDGVGAAGGDMSAGDPMPAPGELHIKEKRTWKTWQFATGMLVAAVAGMGINGLFAGASPSGRSSNTPAYTLPKSSTGSTTTTAAGSASGSSGSTTTTAAGGSTTTTAAGGSTTTTAAGGSTTTSTTAAGSPAAASGPARVLLGPTQMQGNWTSPAFTTTAAGWNIGWAYNCSPAPASGPSFQVFVMPVGASATGTPALSETGPSGQSVTSQSSLGAQDLVVQAPASCTWAVKVTGS